METEMKFARYNWDVERAEKENIQTLRGFSIGDMVTCKHETEAYYSGYGGRPQMKFKPGMLCEIWSFPPKVCIAGELPLNDKAKNFICCRYMDEQTGEIETVSLDFCNTSKV